MVGRGAATEERDAGRELGGDGIGGDWGRAGVGWDFFPMGSRVQEQPDRCYIGPDVIQIVILILGTE